MQLSPGAKSILYGGYRALLRRTARQEAIVWPPIASQAQLDDLIPRLQFHFPEGWKIVLPVSDPAIEQSTARPYYLADYSSRCASKFTIVHEKDRSRNAWLLSLRNRGVLLSKPASEISGGASAKYLPNVAPLDPSDVEMETFWTAKLHTNSGRATEPESRARFLAWRDSLPQKKKAYLLCTGPSLSRFREFDFSDGHVIGCNSVVSNDALMAHSNPVAIVANDPIFHFGPSIYAEKFRQDLGQASTAYPFLFLTSNAFNHLIAPHINLRAERIAAVPLVLDSRGESFAKRWAFPRTSNILTSMMIPLGRAIAEELYIIGADGREPGETYFWKHDAASQLTDKMQAIKDCHPAFFEKRDYVDYYDRHCEILKSQIEDVESSGGKVRSLTPSHIPALKARQ
ncbi:hypothetical protein BH09SUM1_BH09SUM1_11260 [soil metagenome]